MNVLSLFDGMSCGRIAIERAEIAIDNYYTSEIDKYSTKVSASNYPCNIRLGDIANWRNWDIDWSSIDMIFGGFPCQAWSMAGKQLGDKDERGMLFWTMLDIMKHARHHNPKADFLIENVKMKKEFEEYITHHMANAVGNVHKILINSALVSAQNRNRYYWTSFEVTQPEDKGIVLDDLGDECFETPSRSPEWSFIKTKATSGILKVASYGNNSQGQRMYSSEGKHPPLCANKTGGSVLPFLYRNGVEMKLSALGMMKMQNVPDYYFVGFSKTVISQCLGNGWTIDVIVHILKGMKDA